MLYITRHGKTDWNVQEKLQGHVDIPLNQEGIDSAIKAHDKYKSLHFDICYCSPLQRAKRTAEIFLEGTDTPIIIDDRLIEMGFGEYEGVTGYFNNPSCPINDLFVNPAAYVKCGGAESFEELFERTGSFLKEEVYPALDKGKDILIVGHGAMNCSIISQIKGMPLSQFWDNLIGNCELVRLL
ncbi:histidine phosphatase family protein [Butyrivibrio sp. YAB3001]|uniref:histidine phosphatase family protein n=1 Tax=Butyrivibrio sp. YAB3001 TaxID=1520812 RepID=UPI0008F647D3|nr:histidine phosphatase family protein [Butyrivibrio sp. YAB3001]SFB73767.1 probable phosphoglycerate mutase [Butyrivibrio sp. YAB3001]